MRAIILAAGMGTRLQPLTFSTPKSLVEVIGKPMLERQIEYLQEIGVDEIIVVTGYLKEKFEYLKEKYGVTLVQNDKYDRYNNIYSMYIVRKYLPNSFVMEADVYLNNNFLEKNPQKSKYYSARKPEFKGEWKIRFNKKFKVYDIEVGDGNNEFILCGVSYWSEKDGSYIIKKLEEAVEYSNFKNLYWDDIVKDNISELDVYVHEINSDDCYEIDSLEDFEKVNDLVKT